MPDYSMLASTIEDSFMLLPRNNCIRLHESCAEQMHSAYQFPIEIITKLIQNCTFKTEKK